MPGTSVRTASLTELALAPTCAGVATKPSYKDDSRMRSRPILVWVCRRIIQFVYVPHPPNDGPGNDAGGRKDEEG